MVYFVNGKFVNERWVTLTSFLHSQPDNKESKYFPRHTHIY